MCDEREQAWVVLERFASHQSYRHTLLASRFNAAGERLADVVLYDSLVADGHFRPVCFIDVPRRTALAMLAERTPPRSAGGGAAAEVLLMVFDINGRKLMECATPSHETAVALGTLQGEDLWKSLLVVKDGAVGITRLSGDVIGVDVDAASASARAVVGYDNWKACRDVIHLPSGSRDRWIPD